MKNSDVLIIGAGAAGLMAAYTLVNAGKTVTILEARDRIGGRIHTINNNGFSTYVELGAEFVHGNLPVTLSLLKEAGIDTSGVNFEMWQHNDGTFKQSDTFIDGWDMLLEKLNHLKHDMSLHEFLEENFRGNEHINMRSQVQSYVAGYDTADALDASAFALRNEWNNEDEDAQHRINGGYGGMIAYLARVCSNAGNNILLNTVARDIITKNNSVEVIDANGVGYIASKVIVALPLGILQAPDGAAGAIRFYPKPDEHLNAVKNIGFGSVIKILMEFDEIFWEGEAVAQLAGKDFPKMGFLFTDEIIPTFWTQAPAHSPLLTGWLGGPPARDKKDATPETILQWALASLGKVFKMSSEVLNGKLVAWHVGNWTADPYTQGSYTYDKTESSEARKALQKPVENTIYFAGEYLYEGPAMGTVEAALTSGKNVAEMVLTT